MQRLGDEASRRHTPLFTIGEFLIAPRHFCVDCGDRVVLSGLSHCALGEGPLPEIFEVALRNVVPRSQRELSFVSRSPSAEVGAAIRTALRLFRWRWP